MGATHSSVYMANNSGQDIYVLASLTPMWAIVDVAIDGYLLVNGLEELKAAAAITELQTIQSLKDLWEIMKISWNIIGGPVAVTSRPVDAAQSFLDAVKKVSVTISSGEYKDVHDDNFLDLYLNADGLASFAGAETVTMLVTNGDGYSAMWTTHIDYSWIALSG